MNVQQSEDTSEAIAVSILIPVYGVEDYIERCARSIFEQTYPNIEYIFCDDCSPDQSISVLRRVMKDYPLRAKHTRILRHKKNRGLAAARNTLVEACRTDWLMHVDSDDWVEHDAVSLLVKKQSKTKADIVWGDLIKRSHQKEEYVTNPDATYKKDIICKLLDCTVFHHICGKLIRKSIYDDFNIKAVDGIDMGEDWYVVIPLYYHATEYAKVNHCIVHYERRRSQALTAKRERLDVNYLQSDYPAVDIIWSFLENIETSWKQYLVNNTFNRLKINELH